MNRNTLIARTSVPEKSVLHRPCLYQGLVWESDWDVVGLLILEMGCCISKRNFAKLHDFIKEHGSFLICYNFKWSLHE